MAEREIPNSGDQVEQILSRDKKVGQAIVAMFEAFSAKTVGEIWKSDGIGSCRISRERSEIGISGVARDKLIELRDEKNSNCDLEQVLAEPVCVYHRKDFGCVLADLKSPYCFAHIENPTEVLARFGVSDYGWRTFVYDTFRRINAGEEGNFVQEALDKIHQNTQVAVNYVPLDEGNVDGIVNIQPDLG